MLELGRGFYVCDVCATFALFSLSLSLSLPLSPPLYMLVSGYVVCRDREQFTIHQELFYQGLFAINVVNL